MNLSTRRSTLSLKSQSSQKSGQQGNSKGSNTKSTTPSIYSLGNNSSGTLMLQQPNSISKVEFTNVRPEEVPETSHEDGRPKSNRLKRFMHKIKKELDTESIHERVGSELSIQTKFLPRHSSEHKSPLSRTFSRDESKVSFGDRLRLLNSTKYKSYNYHNLIKNKRDKNKLGPKTNDSSTNQGSDLQSLSETYLNEYTVQELEQMIQNHTLSLANCNEYANDIYNSIKQLITPMFKGEKLKYSIEDMTKLIGIYVKLRKTQESIEEQELQSPLTHSTSSSSISELLPPQAKIGFPFVPPSPAESNTQTMSSPVIRIQTNVFSAITAIKEDFLDLMKYLMMTMINQLFYDEFKQDIKFIRGAHHLLTKRRNTLSSIHHQQQQQQHHMSISSFGSSYAPDLSYNDTAQSMVDLPIMPSTKSMTLTPSVATGLGTIFPSLHDQNASSTMSASTIQSLSNLGMLPLGTFERCNSLLWDFFESNVMYELTAIFLPIELESSTGHINASRSRKRADRIKYGSSTQISGIAPAKSALTTYTNTLVHPDYFKTSLNVGSDSTNLSPNQFSDQSWSQNTDSINHVGVIGEWSDINIREWILLAYRDFVVIPLYELNRNYEEVDGVIDSLRVEEPSIIDKYYDAYVLQQCFLALSSLEANDTNQKLVENLLEQMREKCRQLEKPFSD